jgi:hypothetical protein
MLWKVSSSVNTWEVGDYVAWKSAPNVYKSEDGRDIIHRYCDGVAKAWNAVAVETYEYAPTGGVVVIVCNSGLFTFVDIYRKVGHWEVLRRRVSSCDDLRYFLPVVKRVLAREGFGDVEDVVNYIADYWARQIRNWAQL